ncbi:MAG: hypothetical protein F6J98_08340 [Moorea sp. SIO4G2]|nr:hypothetical protein [Moorena sp. SIO3I6]NEO60434.1 hypothetical protein [Moorena sp. SIO4G2]NEP20802.1 hypothetical protein [Moorena sp. SIO3I6]
MTVNGYGGLHNYQVHRIVFPLPTSLLPAPCSLLPKNPERKYLIEL